MTGGKPIGEEGIGGEGRRGDRGDGKGYEIILKMMGGERREKGIGGGRIYEWKEIGGLVVVIERRISKGRKEMR